MRIKDRRNDGYPALAHLMGPHPGMAMYKRFSTLAAHDLLLRQAELVNLEQKLHVQGLIDQQAGLAFSEKADRLFASKKEGVDHDQLDLVLKIRTCLQGYRSVHLSAYQWK